MMATHHIHIMVSFLLDKSNLIYSSAGTVVDNRLAIICYEMEGQLVATRTHFALVFICFLTKASFPTKAHMKGCDALDSVSHSLIQ